MPDALDYAQPPRRTGRVLWLVAALVAVAALVWLWPRLQGAVTETRVATWEARTRALPAASDPEVWPKLEAALDDPLAERVAAHAKGEPRLSVEVEAFFEAAHRLADDLDDAGQAEGPLLDAAEARAIYGPLLADPAAAADVGHAALALLRHAPPTPAAELALMRDRTLAVPQGLMESEASIAFVTLAAARVGDDPAATEVLVAVCQRDRHHGGGHALRRQVRRWHGAGHATDPAIAAAIAALEAAGLPRDPN